MQLLILQNVKIEGYVEFVVKNQTTKYDIKTQKEQLV